MLAASQLVVPGSLSIWGAKWFSAKKWEWTPKSWVDTIMVVLSLSQTYKSISFLLLKNQENPCPFLRIFISLGILLLKILFVFLGS